MKFTIEILQEIHYIEGTQLSMFLKKHNETFSDDVIPIIIHDRSHTLQDLCHSADVIRSGLMSLGNEIEIENKTRPDPNFESAAAAYEFLMNSI